MDQMEMQMEQIVVKTEVQPNGDILLYYVDENQGHELSELSTLENVTVAEAEQLHEGNFVLSNVEESVNEYDLLQTVDNYNDGWQDEEIQKLLVFYTDNKDSFCNGAQNKHLWSVACKTILNGKSPSACEAKLREMKQRYMHMCIEQSEVKWAYFDLCNQAFHDDESVKNYLIEKIPQSATDGILVMKKVNGGRTNTDENVENMLNLYLKYKKKFTYKNQSNKGIWRVIARDLGEEDPDYWHKRFLNFKQHYIRMVCKRNEAGPEKINWPYMKLFDQIFEGDDDFQKKFSTKVDRVENGTASKEEQENIWNDTERTVLVKYYFDCFFEFQDTTIPNNFLWHEIGRLLEKHPESCKQKYRELKHEHVQQLMKGEYDLTNRNPVAILFDNIIAREIDIELKTPPKRTDQAESLRTDEIDDLVQFFYDNTELFKDSVCYYVSWMIVSKKLRKSIYACKKQWDELTSLYKSILEDKKEDPDMEIDWCYIDVFDRIFDYGMDTKFLQGYENMKEQNDDLKSDKVAVKKLHVKDEDHNDECSDDEESYDERGFTKHSKRRPAESKGFKILEYYLKNKEKFQSYPRKKIALWEILAKQLGITANQCAHRFRHLKQVYTGYVQREINKPDMPILWPYYALCKKVFGYRAIKSKLKNGKMDSDDSEEWMAREIKQLINYFANNYDTLNNNVEDFDEWSPIASEIGKTSRACCEKFLELRKSYRKLKTMKSRNPDVKVSWKYFKLMDDIYNLAETKQEADTSTMDVAETAETMDVDIVKTELPDDEKEKANLTSWEPQPGMDDEFQYIIVIPEEQEMELAENVEQMLLEGTAFNNTQDTTETKPHSNKWNRRNKKHLLLHYLKYLKSHKGKEIDSREMWREISAKLNKAPLTCRRILIKLKNQHRLSASSDDFKMNSPYYSIIEKILTLKPKFAKISKDKGLKEKKSYKDVAMPDGKVEKALQYYLDHIEEFSSPRYEKKYVWMELANAINEPALKVFNKINYLKHSFSSKIDSDTDMPFSDILQEINTKEWCFKNDPDMNDANDSIDQDTTEYIWTDDEIEQLLTWYLAHLDKFKNPKYVRSYLWLEASEMLNKSPLTCSKKMSEIRTQYRNMVKEASEELNDWRFYELCQKIYGTGKKPYNIN